MKKILLISMLMFAAQWASADILSLLNGQIFEGRVQKIKECTVVFNCAAEKYYIPSDSIFSLEFEDVNDPVYTDYLALASGDQCMKGRMDAEHFHGKAGAHVALGFLFGPFAVIGAALANPNPYKGRRTVFSSPNRELFSDPVYLQCYKKKARARNVGHAIAGWAALVIIAFATS